MMRPRGGLSGASVHALTVSALACLLGWVLLPMLLGRFPAPEDGELPAVTRGFLSWRGTLLLLPLLAAGAGWIEQQLSEGDPRRFLAMLASVVIGALSLAAIGWMVIAIYALVLVPAI